MNLKKINVIVIFAVFCVIISACAVNAIDHGNLSADSICGNYIGHDGLLPSANTHHAAGGDYYLNERQNGHNGTVAPVDAAHDESKMLNQTGHAAGENVTNTTNSNLSNSNINASLTHKLHATGNPIVILLGVCTLLSGYCIIRKN